MKPSFRELAQEAIAKLVRERNLALEGLTQEQFCECLLKAIASGDFQRHVGLDESQQVVYLPEAKAFKLQMAIREALEHLDTNEPGAARTVLQWAVSL